MCMHHVQGIRHEEGKGDHGDIRDGQSLDASFRAELYGENSREMGRRARPRQQNSTQGGSD